MEFTVDLAQLVGLLLASLRVGTWMLLAPPFSYGAFPIRIKFMVGVAIALVMRPDVPPDMLAEGLNEAQIITWAAQEVLIGGALGFLCLLIFLVVQAAGNLIDMMGGFAMAQMFDQQVGGMVSPIGRIYYLTSLVLLFVTNGHLLILRGLLETFELIPVGEMFSLSAMGALTTEVGAQFMMTAVQIGGPIMGVLFLADVGLGLLVRIAPQLNVLMLAFPLKIGITLILVSMSFVALPEIIRGLTDLALSTSARFAKY